MKTPHAPPVPGALALLLLLTALTFDARAATLTVGASKDNTLYEDQAGSISNGIGEHLFVGRVGIAGDSTLRRGLIAFDLSSLPANATVTAVQLTLNLSRSSPTGPATVTLHRMTRNWGEGNSFAFEPGASGTAAAPGDATWTTPFFGAATPVTWTTPGGDFSATVSASLPVDAQQAYTFGSTANMVADVQGWVQNPGNNFGWMLRGDEANAGSAKRFDTKENSFETFRPSLTVTFDVPEPAALPLLAGIALLAARRRRAA